MPLDNRDVERREKAYNKLKLDISILKDEVFFLKEKKKELEEECESLETLLKTKKEEDEIVDELLHITDTNELLATIVERVMNLSRKDFFGKGQQREFTYCKSIFVNLKCEFYFESFAIISNLINRDRTVCNHYVKQHHDVWMNYTDYRCNYERCASLYIQIKNKQNEDIGR